MKRTLFNEVGFKPGPGIPGKMNGEVQRTRGAIHDDAIKWKQLSALLAFCERDPPVIGGFPSWRLATRSFDVFFELRLNKRLGKQSKRRWFQTLSCSLWRYCNANDLLVGGLVWYQKYTLCWHKEKWWASMYVIPVLSILKVHIEWTFESSSDILGSEN